MYVGIVEEVSHGTVYSSIQLVGNLQGVQRRLDQWPACWIYWWNSLVLWLCLCPNLLSDCWTCNQWWSSFLLVSGPSSLPLRPLTWMPSSSCSGLLWCFLGNLGLVVGKTADSLDWNRVVYTSQCIESSLADCLLRPPPLSWWMQVDAWPVDCA